MADSEQLIEALDQRVQRRDARREFFRAAFGMGAMAVGGAAALSFSSKAEAQTITDNDILNFALNLEYLEAQFYAYAASGQGLPSNLLGGVTTTGAQGAVITGTGANAARQVGFTDPAVRAYAQEIAADELAHVAFLRTALTSGSTTLAVAQPAIDISGGLRANGTPSAFTAVARAAGVVGPNAIFDPYASDEDFLLAAYIFEDVGVTAYKGASPLLTNRTFLQAAAGILAAEAYHAAIVRTTLYAKGIQVPSLITAAQQISDARDTLDGTGNAAGGLVNRAAGRTNPGDLDQGITPMTIDGQIVSNIVPTDNSGIVFSRTAGQVLNIVYVDTSTTGTNPATDSASVVSARLAASFFPNGVNGNIRASIGTA